MKRLLLTFALLAPAFSSFADCWEQAGARYGIEPELLQAIAMVESSLNPKATNTNTNGTADFGLMQINSSHLATLKKFNITSKHLLNDPCQNVMTGAWILAGNIRRFGYSWEAVGAYNAGTAQTPQRQALRQKYIRKVVPQYLKLKQMKMNG
ncbi:lytic transglycosylase domain-containing protein [Serratia sp. AKBS12]|uniref:lytic transglycosylase domain-containing protein n=1 Tax=Serratia sp. AKBS12 TaxID=2974597 RepID=UPI00216508B9|nr:lytic transglycosylase domain-containing protein [Serratia sp. AKBS12]MCS3407096.1 lytic transglycosylase domain-containing protein [Serratia sp. AKBS12]HEI8868859.1 lytic transglycosylase domain-containing protein [Serratia odorifera]